MSLPNSDIIEDLDNMLSPNREDNQATPLPGSPIPGSPRPLFLNGVDVIFEDSPFNSHILPAAVQDCQASARSFG